MRCPRGQASASRADLFVALLRAVDGDTGLQPSAFREASMSFASSSGSGRHGMWVVVGIRSVLGIFLCHAGGLAKGDCAQLRTRSPAAAALGTVKVRVNL